MNIKIYVPDIECESCVTLLQKKFIKTQGIQTTKFSQEKVDISFDETKIKTEDILELIRKSGYRASLTPFEKKTFKERKREFFENKTKFELERRIITYSLGLFLILTFLEVIAYFIFLKNIPDFISRFAWWIIYLNLSVATLGTALWHYLAYKATPTCMLGMMIGMTMGMQTGMMIGAIFGATNGLFLGSVIGLILGVSVGIYTGKCCGIMGTLQGMMAGLMGGIMGPMTTLMLFSDHLLWFMPLYILVNILIVWGFSYMVFEEMVEYKEVEKFPHPFTTLTFWAIVVTTILLALMVYGIRSPLLGG